MKEKFAKIVSKVRWYFLKRKWIKALRSGKYKQGYGWTAKNGSYCCLGVLCDVSGRGKWVQSGRFSDCLNYELPSGEQDAASADHTVPELSHEDQARLAGMNDEGKSFAEIAAYIKENL